MLLWGDERDKITLFGIKGVFDNLIFRILLWLYFLLLTVYAIQMQMASSSRNMQFWVDATVPLHTLSAVCTLCPGVHISFSFLNLVNLCSSSKVQTPSLRSLLDYHPNRI